MKAYILSVAGVILISAIISILVPSGKMGKFIKGMTKLFILAVLISPFVSWLKGGDFLFSSKDVGSDEKYLRNYVAMLTDEDEAAIEAALAEEYGIGTEVAVSRSFDDFSYEKIKVVVLDFGINGDESHIDILSNVKTRLTSRFGCPVEVT